MEERVCKKQLVVFLEEVLPEITRAVRMCLTPGAKHIDLLLPSSRILSYLEVESAGQKSCLIYLFRNDYPSASFVQDETV